MCVCVNEKSANDKGIYIRLECVFFIVTQYFWDNQGKYFQPLESFNPFPSMRNEKKTTESGSYLVFGVLPLINDRYTNTV